MEPGRVEEKTGEEKTRCDPAALAKPDCKPVDLYFLLKRRRFDFKKKRIDPVKTRNPDLRPGRVLKLCLEVFLKNN